MAEGNRLPSLENAPHLKTDGEFFLPLRLSCKESSTFLTKPLFPQEREDVTALRCSEPLRYKVGGASKPSPGFAEWDRLNCSSLQYRSALVVARMRNIIFILLLTGLPLERYPSGLWRKSYDRHCPYVPKWNRRAILYLLKPSSTSCLILLATSNCSSRTIIWIYISLPQASMQIGKSTTFISNNPWSLWNKLVKSLLR